MKIESKKDVIKIIRSVIEFAVVVSLVALTLRALFVSRKYVPYDSSDPTVVTGEDHGFIALSYLGVDREGTSTLISTEQLSEQLHALSDLGYVTIRQQDIIDYYENGKPLPDKALFLMFEDGRNDTSIFAQPIMEECNFIASIFSYAEKFLEQDTAFSMADDLLSLEESGFWELGSNGYRLQYINVFDRNGRFLGELTSKEYAMIMPLLGQDYNQYLMDFIRDKNRLPVETPDMMRRRVTGEYELMRSMYLKELGKVPRAYVLMHSNTGNFGNNDKVSKVNEECMTKIYDMNFNREGFSLNHADTSIYDLTRMQPDAWWSTNHLLMRIKWDLPEEDRDTITFVSGDQADYGQWEILEGALECLPDKERVIVTSEPEGPGLARWKGSGTEGALKDVSVEATLKGNKLGAQTIFLRADQKMTEYVAVSLDNNVITVSESGGDALFTLDLHDLDKEDKISEEEFRRDSMAEEYAALARFAGSYRESLEYKKLERETRMRPARSVAEGAEEYIPPILANEAGNRELKVILQGDSLTLYVDGNAVCEEVSVTRTLPGNVVFGASGPDLDGDGNRVPDDIYDGIFDRIRILSADYIGEDGSQTLYYSNRATGWKMITFTVQKAFRKVVNWFIMNL